MKTQTLLFTTLLTLFTCAPSHAGQPAPQSFAVREQLAADIAKKWNAADTMGEFLSKNVDKKISLLDREKFQSLTAGYRWLPIPRAVPIKDTIVFHNGEYKTVLTVTILSLVPLTLDMGGERKTFSNTKEVYSFLTKTRDELPDFLKPKAKNKRRELSSILNLLTGSEAHAELSRSDISMGIMGAGLLAYAAMSGSRSNRQAHPQPIHNTVNNTVVLNFPDQVAVNLRNVTEEQRAMQAEELRNNRLAFRSQLGRWINSSVVAGSCESNGSFGPRMTTRPIDGLPSLAFQQRVLRDGIHQLEISFPGQENGERFVVEKVFGQNSDITPDHRVFSDEVTRLRQCRGSTCTVVQREDFSTTIWGVAMQSINQAQRDRFTREMSEIDNQIQVAKDDLAKLPNLTEVDRDIAARYSERVREAHQNVVDRQNRRREAEQQRDEIIHSIQELERNNRVGLFGRRNPTNFQTLQLIFSANDAEASRLLPTYHQELRRLLRENGTAQRVSVAVRDSEFELENARQAQSRLYREQEQEILRMGLNTGTRQGYEHYVARYFAGRPQHPSTVLKATAICVRFSDICQQTLLGHAANGEIPTDAQFQALRTRVAERIQNEINQGANAAQATASRRLSDLIATNYAVAMCCDQSECRNIISAQMRLTESAPTDNPEEPAPIRPGAAAPAR